MANANDQLTSDGLEAPGRRQLPLQKRRRPLLILGVTSFFLLTPFYFTSFCSFTFFTSSSSFTPKYSSSSSSSFPRSNQANLAPPPSSLTSSPLLTETLQISEKSKFEKL